uniref:Uncharacterized protein n=1 Tax=Bionectria ochroleuca TaxID=29856 RepID=A0A8H7NFF7_BIOOC
MTNAFFTGFRRRYPLLACYAPRRFFLPSALSSIFCRFSQGVPVKVDSVHVKLFEYFSFFFPFSFTMEDGNRSTMRKENMYNINKRGREKKTSRYFWGILQAF